MYCYLYLYIYIHLVIKPAVNQKMHARRQMGNRYFLTHANNWLYKGFGIHAWSLPLPILARKVPISRRMSVERCCVVHVDVSFFWERPNA